MTQLFHSIHAHQMVRVAAATPRASVGDIDANLDAAVAMAREADARGVDCVVFPELNLTSYALDDLHLQSAQQRASDAAVVAFAERTAAWAPLLLVGAALVRNGRLYNCAVAVHRGRILGVVPKSFLPNYREYYEKRWFAPGLGLTGLTIRLGDADVPFGTDLLFAAEDLPGFVVHAEICEDYWAPTPPSTMGALAGATICCNLSASNIVIGKARERMLLAAAQSARAACAYVYSAAGPGESTTDLAWDGQGLIYELGELLTESSRFSNAAELVVADIDCERLVQERLRNGTFNDSAAAAGHPERDVRRIGFTHGARDGDTGLDRRIRRFPFVPDDPARRDEDCYEAFNIQVEALVKRLSATGSKTLVIGVSGGLDSTHALIFLIRWCIRTDQYDAATNTVLATILAQEISPELVPADADTGAMQSTESMIGPYALNDFFAHYVIRHGLAPSKIAFLAWHAWHDAAQGGWPEDVPADARVAYDLPTIKYWLERFLVRFFQTSQFKRSAIPNGPKVSAGGALSPRGDWRAPSDGTASVWLNELRRNVP
ncbi:hypothetical protein WR25_08440 [Diploscapter pachys]|uniref:Glutamine-dependent NAD(+) synthetase n=1 Tax=Diploscapter pachys TaxID=2018661 RepID=A0A2A2K721_9BILA|nr:hypothetical protein WR25_08440 [Diploscapter pachys]